MEENPIEEKEVFNSIEELEKGIAESFNKDEFTSDMAVIEHVVKKYLKGKYGTKIINVPLIDKITQDLKKALDNLGIAANIKSKIILNARSSLLSVHQELIKKVNAVLKEKRKK